MPARIVEAMCELKERRDEGELVHKILPQVAQTHEVPLQELRSRAEVSWGTPLETDRERHAAHFELLANADDVSEQSRKLAHVVYEANLPSIKEFRWWQVNWEHVIDDALQKVTIDPALLPIARSHFLNEAERLEKSIKMVRAQNA